MLTLVECLEVVSHHNSEVLNTVGSFSLTFLRQCGHDTFSCQLSFPTQWGAYQVVALDAKNHVQHWLAIQGLDQRLVAEIM